MYRLVHFQHVSPTSNFTNPNSEADYNSHFIFKRAKYWVYSYQLLTWRTFPSMRAFNFPANTFILFPLTKNKNH